MTFRETILACLEAADTTVINKCLKLLADMVDEATLPATVATMTATIPRVDADAGDRIIALVIQICSRDRYALLQDFPWYVRTLVDLAHTPRTGHGALIAAQLEDDVLRKVLRRYPPGRIFPQLGMQALERITKGPHS